MDNINKIPTGTNFILGTTNMRMTITNEDTGEILYSHPTHGGVITSCESYKVLKETKEIEGNQETLMWGHPAVVVHCFAMLRDNLELAVQNKDWRAMAEGIFE